MLPESAGSQCQAAAQATRARPAAAGSHSVGSREGGGRALSSTHESDRLYTGSPPDL